MHSLGSYSSIAQKKKTGQENEYEENDEKSNERKRKEKSKM